MKTSLLAFCACLALWVSAAHANDRKWELGGGVGPNFSQLDAVGDDLQSGLGLAFWVDRYIDQNWFGEFSYGWFNFGGGSTHLDAYILGVGYRFDDWGKFSPYAVVGAGLGAAKDFPRSTPRQTGFMWHFRPGADYKLNEKWKVGLAFDWSMIKLDGNMANAAYMGLPLFTVGYAWGGSDQQAPAVVQVTAPAKPAEPVVVEVDSDGDGVLDSRDKCPGTPASSKVNGFGCIRGEKIQLKIMVNFETGSDVVPPEADDELKQIADLLKRNPKASVQIEGHTDSVGKRAMNMDLSKRRAASVATYIVEKFGIEKSRITSRGYGPTKPIATNETAEGRAQNRRVLGTFKSNE